MPSRMMKPCAVPGCSNLVDRGRCEAHAEVMLPAYRRDAEVHRLYDRRWQERRMRWLAGHPWCEECLRRGLYVPAVDVHHVVRHRGEIETFVTSPLQSLCHACHSQITAREQGGSPLKKFTVGSC
jgi:5-methylcytosine-specific restriction protein A